MECRVPRRELIIGGPTFFSHRDEDSFFNWLQSISCVEDVVGNGRDLHITLKRQPRDSQLRELIAVLYRYRMDMSPLAILLTARNAAWFAKNRSAFWHTPVFGNARRR